MVDPKAPNVVCLFLLMQTTAFQENAPHHLQSPPSYDPRLTHFVWFSTFRGSSKLENEDFSNTINIKPVMLPGAVGPLVDLKKNKNKIPKVQKIVMRL